MIDRDAVLEILGRSGLLTTGIREDIADAIISLEKPADGITLNATDDELQEYPQRVWGAVEYGHNGPRELRAVIRKLTS